MHDWFLPLPIDTVLVCRVCFVEVFLHPEDCSADLLEWGSRLAEYNARPPNPKWHVSSSTDLYVVLWLFSIYVCASVSEHPQTILLETIQVLRGNFESCTASYYGLGCRDSNKLLVFVSIWVFQHHHSKMNVSWRKLLDSKSRSLVKFSMQPGCMVCMSFWTH